MDLLGSILNAMDKQGPPRRSEKEKQLRKQQKEIQEKARQNELSKIRTFRSKVEDIVHSFVRDDTKQQYTFEPMDSTAHLVIHEVTEVAGLPSYSFGEEGVDRHVQIFKREYAPNEKELDEMRRNRIWSLSEARQNILQREKQIIQDEEEQKRSGLKRKANFTPACDYKDKYKHLIGTDAAKDAAKRTVTNKQYGFVPSENKKDQRSIEQTLADLRAKKKQKTGEGSHQDQD